MSTGYALAYRLGITPWERAGQAADAQRARLLDREDRAHPERGRALDLGCGRGTHAIELARRGWQVTGIDLIPHALKEARRRAEDAGQHVTFLEGDVTSLPSGAGTGYRFVLDVGCFHGLSDPQRLQMGRQVSAVTDPTATMLVLSFAPGGRGPLPRGAGAADLVRAFPGWSITDQEAAQTEGMPPPLRHRAPVFYSLRRQ